TVVQLERFEPFSWFVACVIESGSLAPLPASERASLIERLKKVTPPAGRHAIMPAAKLSSDALRSLYGDWDIVRSTLHGTRKPRSGGFTAIRPAESQIVTDVAVSE